MSKWLCHENTWYHSYEALPPLAGLNTSVQWYNTHTIWLHYGDMIITQCIHIQWLDNSALNDLRQATSLCWCLLSLLDMLTKIPNPTLPATTGVRLLIFLVKPNYHMEVSCFPSDSIYRLWLGATLLLASFQIVTKKKKDKIVAYKHQNWTTIWTTCHELPQESIFQRNNSSGLMMIRNKTTLQYR